MPEYDFRALSPIDFEDLTRDILNAHFGASFTTFAVGPDGGVDLRDSSRGTTLVAQCKHRPDDSKRALIKAASTEAARLDPSEIDTYVFVTSAVVSPPAEKAILNALAPLPVGADGLYHRGRLSTLLTSHPAVARSHFKLWLASGDVLAQIIRGAEWQKSEALLARVADRVRIYVTTMAFVESANILDTRNAVVITGAPGTGKSTLAEMLLLNHWHEGWRIVNVTDDIPSAWATMAIAPKKTVLYCDDFLGQTNIAEVVGGSAGSIGLLLDRVRNGNGDVKLILTTRDQVIAQAQAGPDDRLRRLSVDDIRSRVVLSELTRGEKARILFNHLYFSVSGEVTRGQLADDHRYFRVIDHPGFNPRVIETATLRQFLTSADEFYERVLQALDSPEEIWAGSFAQLSELAMNVVFDLAMTPGNVLDESTLRGRALGKVDPRDWTSALKVLEGSWISITTTSRGAQIALFDPSRRDFVHSLLQEAPYFDHVLGRIRSVYQLEYLVRLCGGNTSQTNFSRGQDLSPVQKNMAQSLDDISALLLNLLSTDLKHAHSEEEAISQQNAEASAAAKGGPRQYFLNDRAARSQLLRYGTSLSAFLRSANIAQDTVQAVLLDEVERFVRDVTDTPESDASELFALAGVLNESGLDSMQSYARQLVRVGSSLIAGQMDFDSLDALIPGLVTDDLIAEVRDDLKIALEADLDAISSFHDTDVVEQWIGDVQNRAEMYGVVLYMDSVYEHLELIRSKPSKPAISPTPTTTAALDSDNATIIKLFQRLR